MCWPDKHANMLNYTPQVFSILKVVQLCTTNSNGIKAIFVSSQGQQDVMYRAYLLPNLLSVNYASFRPDDVYEVN